MLIKLLEQKTGSEIIVKEMDFTANDAKANARGGFVSFKPFVDINRARREFFDEHSLAHELLHIKRFLEGAYFLEAVGLGNRSKIDCNNLRAFASDVTNQIEHIAIFPDLIAYGFNPCELANEWKRDQIKDFSSKPAKWGPVDHSHACIKIGVGEFLGVDKNLHDEYKKCFAGVDMESVRKGEEIAKEIQKRNLNNLVSLKRLYKQVFKIAGIPKGDFVLKQLDLANNMEKIENI